MVNSDKTEQELPPFTLKNVIGDIKQGVHALLFDPFYKRLVGPIIILSSSIITKFVIALIPYTEIDFSTYMQQIALINQGEKDYSEIKGDSGPLVYPAGFVQVYRFIYWLSKDGTDIKAAQTLFSYVFTFTVMLTLFTYVDAPPWTLGLLLGSKRLISIYVLRLFNDCFTTGAMVCVTLILQQLAVWHKQLGPRMVFVGSLVAADVFSLAISIKMNALLYFPGFIIVIYFLNGENLVKSLAVLFVIPLIQLTTGWDFLVPLYNDEGAKYLRWMYLTNAFKFDRKFLYEWTVNWRFISQETFDSSQFHNALLVGHICLLCVFIFTRYLSPRLTGKSIWQLIKHGLAINKSTVSPNNQIVSNPRLIMTILSSTNLIGVLFARSLHYQFLSWYCWQLPYLLYITDWPFITCIVIWGLHEWCWLTFPSTELSSGLLVAIITVVLLGVWNAKVWTPLLRSDNHK